MYYPNTIHKGQSFMPMPGGAADKYGNRYEGLWTVQCMIRVLKQEYKSIYLEEPGIDYAEFRVVTAAGVSEFHQVKRQNGTEGRWRINDLKNRGVLDSFWECTAKSSQKYVFVSIDNVEILPELIDRANKANSLDDFSKVFLATNKNLKKVFSDIVNHVNSTEEEVYSRLRNLVSESISETLLLQQVEWGIVQFTGKNAPNAVDVLAQYAIDQVHVNLTRDSIIQHLQDRDIFLSAGLTHKERKYYPLPLKPNPFISRSSILRTLIQRFSSDTRIVIVRGVDGAGKTTLLTQFIEENAANSFYFFIGRDWTSNTTTFLRDICGQFQNELGEKNDLNQLQYDELRDSFGRLCRDIARLARQTNKPYYLVIDGLENVQEEPGRETIIDLIQLDFEGLFVLASTNRDLSLSLPYFSENLDYFTPADTEKYFSDLELAQSQLNDIFNISEGLPVYLNQLRREIEGGKPIPVVLNNLPATFYDLLSRDWNTSTHSDDELDLLAILAHAEMLFDDVTFSAVTKLSKGQIQQILDDTQIVEFNSKSHNYLFVTDAHRSFIAELLADRVEYVNETLISYYQEDIFSDESLERLPLLLHITRNKYDTLKSLVNINYLDKSLIITHDMSLLRRNTQLMIDAANRFGEEKDVPTLSKFSLISSLLKTFTEESADKFEIQALLATGEYQKSLNLAYQAPLLEDKLELLSVIGRELKQNNGSLLENVVSELERMIADIVPNMIIRERALDISTDLFVIHPQAALDLLEKVADTNGKYSIDVLLAILAIRLESDNQAIPDTLKSRITNEKLREFVTASSPSIANVLAEDIISEAERIGDISGKLFLLRSWCNENRKNPEAIKVIETVLQIIHQATAEEYSPSMLHLRQFAEPLMQYEYNKLLSRIIETFRDIKATALQQPFEEAIRLDLILLKLEGKESKEVMHEQLLELYVGLDQIQELDVLCYCYVQILLNLQEIDPDDEMALAKEIEQLLPDRFEELLSGSSDQFKVSERILRALTKYGHQLAVEFAGRLNTSSRRDDAYAEIMRVYVSTDNVLTDSSFLNETLNLISDIKHQNQILVLLLGAFAEKFDLNTHHFIEGFITRLDKVADPIDLAFGYCHAFILYIKSDNANEAELCFNNMKAAWTQIDLLPARIDVGFNIVIMLSEYAPQEAKLFYEIVSTERKRHPLSNGTLVELFANLLSLSIRSVVVFKDKPELEDRLEEIIANIDQIPSRSVKARYYADLVLRLHLAEVKQYPVDILDNQIFPLIDVCENISDRKEVLSIVLPAFFRVSRDSFNEAIKELDGDHDAAVHTVIVHLISKRTPSDPISLEQNNFSIDNSTALEVCSLIELLRTDSMIYSATRLLVESSIYKDPKPHNPKAFSCYVSENTALSIARRLVKVIESKLPDPQNISHAGYKILCYAHLARLRDVAKRAKSRWDTIVPSWSEIITQARAIPNIPDKILVITWISGLIAEHDKAQARNLVKEAEELIYAIPNVIDRSDSLTEVAQAWHKLDNELASRYLLTEAMKIIEGLSWDDTKDQTAAQILQAAHAVDPALASSLTSVIDNPLIQNRLQNQVFSKDLFKEPHKLRLSDDIVDYRPVINAAYEITKAMNSGTYHTLLDKSIMQWLTIGSELPFFMSYPVRLLEIQNYIGASQNDMRSGSLGEVYANLLDSLKLIGLISSELYPYDFSDTSSNVPKSLKTIPIKSKNHFDEFIANWLANTRNISTIDIYDSTFSYQDLSLILPYAKIARVKIFTSWTAQELVAKDTSVSDLFRHSWYKLTADAPYDLQVSLFETESGLCPIESLLYMLDGIVGVEVIPNRNYLEKAYLHIRELTADESYKRSQDCLQEFLITPIREYKNERVFRTIIHID